MCEQLRQAVKDYLTALDFPAWTDQGRIERCEARLAELARLVDHPFPRLKEIEPYQPLAKEA